MQLRAARVVIIYFLIGIGSAHAGNRLTLETDAVLYSGPSLKFRPSLSVKKGDSFLFSRRTVTGPTNEEFYKVLIKNKKSPVRVAYLPVSVEVKIENTDDNDDVDSYKGNALADSAFQVGFHILKDSLFVWTFGYQKYVTESFYLKGLAGQLLNKKSGSLVFGAEAGSDQPAFDRFSLYAAFATGVFLLPEANALFQGSQTLNYFVQGATGIRYNADENAAISLGVFQMALLTANNSLLSPGFSLTLEVGL